MHIVVLGQEARYQAYRPAMPFLDRQTPAFLDKDSTEAEIAAASPEAEVLFVDAITPVSGAVLTLAQNWALFARYFICICAVGVVFYFLSKAAIKLIRPILDRLL